MILITGATGLVGGSVLRELLARNAGPLRAMCRNAKDKAALPAGVQAVEGDFTDAASLRSALNGVKAAYLVCAAIPQLVNLETNFLQACAQAKTPHVVVQSALGAADFGKSFPSWHRQVEQKAKTLGVPTTILRPNGFMQNIETYFAPTIRAQDAFFDALGQSKISYIDVRDIAAAAAAAIVAPELIGSVFELSGPQPISHQDLATRISKVAGRPISYVSLTPQQMTQGMIASGMPAERVTPVVDLYEYYHSGKGAASDAPLRDLIGKAPRTIDAYLSENALIFKK